MIFGRKERSDGANASSGANFYNLNSGAVSGSLEDIDERLQRIRDEEAWRNSHTRLILKYNFSSLAFWLLCAASICFASLNAHYGFTGGITSSLVAGVFIAIMYFSIELTIPVSAHWVSWSGDGGHKWPVRIIGTLAYVLGIAFSLLILQGKFSGAADTMAAKSEISSQLFSSDTAGLTQAIAQRAQLSSKVKRDADAIQNEMDTVLSSPFGKQTLDQVTDGCGGSRPKGKARELCAKVDDLKIELGNSQSLSKLDDKITNLKNSLKDSVSNGTATKTADASDKALSEMTGWSTASIGMFKASFLSMIAAFITHMLWGAHGMVVNSSIRGRQREHMEVNALQRAVDRAKKTEQKTAEQTSIEFARKRGMDERVAAVMTNAPISEKPAAMQVQAFFTERTVMGDEYSQSIGIIHDDYVHWAKSGKLQILNISRFGEVVRGIGMTVSQDGRIIGAALR